MTPVSECPLAYPAVLADMVEVEVHSDIVFVQYNPVFETYLLASTSLTRLINKEVVCPLLSFY
jgi:hypothetical protein